MSEIILYGLKNCDTCKKALSALEGAGHAVTLVDIRTEADLERKLPQWLVAEGPQTVVNRRSTTWRNLPDAERVKADAPTTAQSLLIDNPTLIKRPVIEAGGKVYVGWSKDVSAALT